MVRVRVVIYNTVVCVQAYEDGRAIENIMASALSFRNITQFDGPPCSKASQQCFNGGECLPRLNEYDCRCPPEWMGTHCELCECFHPFFTLSVQYVYLFILAVLQLSNWIESDFFQLFSCQGL
jgi:hypothetical protein